MKKMDAFSKSPKSAVRELREKLSGETIAIAINNGHSGVSRLLCKLYDSDPGDGFTGEVLELLKEGK